jgi:hypothetical protein
VVHIVASRSYRLNFAKQRSRARPQRWARAGAGMLYGVMMWIFAGQE